MPIHDWTRVPSGVFHHFHQDWTIEIARTLNRGLLPPGYSALAEQRAGGPIPDVLTLQNAGAPPGNSAVTTLEPPKTRFVHKTTAELLARRGNRIAIRHQLGRIVAVIEIVSPGNKESRSALRDFVAKAVEFLREGVHLLIVDLFPPSSRDPAGIHKAIWDELQDQDFTLPPDKPLTLVSYKTESQFVSVPLETTYQATWTMCPEVLRTAVVTGVMPDEEAED